MTGTPDDATDHLWPVLDAFASLSSSLDLTRTADSVLVGLKALSEFDQAWLYVRERDGAGSMVCHRSYRPGETPSNADSTDLTAGIVAKTYETGRACRAEVGARASVATPVIGGLGRVIAVMVVERGGDPMSETDLDVLMSYARAAAPSIERALLYSQIGSDRRLMGELEVARQVLSGLLPRETPRLEGFDMAAVVEPAYEVGGDYYDFIPLGNDRWAFAMADVSGKGAPAALVVAAMRATLYTLAKRELALRAILQRANEFIYASTGPRAKYVTLFYAVLDLQARRFLYINAGHLPPIVLRASGDVELLRSGGFPLGFFDNPRYFEQFVKLESGDMLCLYTDGITEASNENDEEYGRERLVEVLRRHQGSSSSEVCRAVLADASHYSDRAFSDDATVLVIRAV